MLHGREQRHLSYATVSFESHSSLPCDTGPFCFIAVLSGQRSARTVRRELGYRSVHLGLQARRLQSHKSMTRRADR